MSGHRMDSSSWLFGHSLLSLPSSPVFNVNNGHDDTIKSESKRSPMVKDSEAFVSFDKQVTSQLAFSQGNLSTDTVDEMLEKRFRPELVQSIESIEIKKLDLDEVSDGLQHRAQIPSIIDDQADLETKKKAQSGEHSISLVVALFCDGFVCRHVTKEKKSVDGFMQPYDADSSYFLACIDNGCVPEGFYDMIACAHHHSNVLAEIRDFRNLRTCFCPVSSATLSPASTLLQAASELEVDCFVWQTLLLPENCTPLNFAQGFSLVEQPTMPSMFACFPDVHPNELESFAVDATKQLLQEEHEFLVPSSTGSSPLQNNLQEVSSSFKDPFETQPCGNHDFVRSTTPPNTRLVTPAPLSLLSPIERKSVQLNRNDRVENTRCKRQIQTTRKRDGQLKYDRKPCRNEGNGIADDDCTESSASCSKKVDHFKSPRICLFQQCCLEDQEFSSEKSLKFTPLPATPLRFLKLKGKRQRLKGDEVLDRKPARLTVAHIKTFVRAAARLEREHSRFLQVNARRLMQAKERCLVATEHVAGSMCHLARQLGDLSRPSDVIAVAFAREAQAVEGDEQAVEKDEQVVEEDERASIWAKARSCNIHPMRWCPDKEPILDLKRTSIDQGEDIIMGHFTTDTVSLIEEYQPTAAAPHFNAFDNDGNLQF